MRHIVRFAAGVLVAGTVLGGTAWGQGKNPCELITKAEAESVVGGKLEGPQLSPRGTLCKFTEAGYGDSDAKNKMVTIGLFTSAAPDPGAVNMRRQFVLQDKSLLPVVSRELPGIGDAAIWVWAGGYFGALYTFKGGKLEVAVKISGAKEEAALAAAKKFATRALGGTGSSGFAYAPPGTFITDANYQAPGILSPLYLGALSQIADDEMTRNYVMSLVQTFNGDCQTVGEMFAVMSYGAYYSWKANNGILSAAAKNNFEKGIQQWMEEMHRAKPHILQIGKDDAATFLKLHKGPDGCMTPAVAHLYRNIEELALERQHIPPDVDNYKAFLKSLSPAAQREYKNGFEGQLSAEGEEQLQKVKNACLVFTKGAASSMEGFCRCQTDAAKESNLPKSDLDLLGTKFTQETMTSISGRSSEYAKRRKACYN